MAWVLEHDEWSELLELAYRAARRVLGEHDAALDTAAQAIEHLLDKERRGQAMPRNVGALAHVVAENLASDRLGTRPSKRAARTHPGARRSGSRGAPRQGRPDQPAACQARLFEPTRSAPAAAA